jgi:phosphatidylserine/phosphatidylglycerophosphate/cardiolipin synthase-like enzyme
VNLKNESDLKMKKTIENWALAVLFAIALVASGATKAAQPIAVDLRNCGMAIVAFSPDGGGTELIIKTISEAKKTVRMATYSFTEPKIGKALLDAKKRGVDVVVIVDEDHNGKRKQPSISGFLKENGVRVMVATAYKIQHNKVVIVDGETVQTGSFNYSRSAENANAENVLVIQKCPALAAAYLQDWTKLERSIKPGAEKLL